MEEGEQDQGGQHGDESGSQEKETQASDTNCSAEPKWAREHGRQEQNPMASGEPTGSD